MHPGLLGKLLQGPIEILPVTADTFAELSSRIPCGDLGCHVARHRNLELVSRYRDDESYVYPTWENVWHATIGKRSPRRACGQTQRRRPGGSKRWVTTWTSTSWALAASVVPRTRRVAAPPGTTTASSKDSSPTSGAHYDLHLDGRPLRVVVVGQEYGAPRPGIDPSRISMAERYQKVHDGSGLERRYYADGTHSARNPHMRGTTAALRVIFGEAPGSDWEQEFLESAGGDRFHLFDAFSLVSVLLCSNFGATKNTGASTKTMRRNCLKHFAATMQILEPTLMVLQGEGVQDWIAPVLGLMDERAPHLAETQVAGNRVLVCRFSHPAARGSLSWGNRPDVPYLREVVEPTLRLAVSLL